MKLLVDLHTHSKFSRFGHGKNSIEEMVYKANELGLKEIAITDHGYKHFFRTSKQNLIRAREIINELNTWSKTKVLLGIEADILNENGDLDIDEETLDLIDILVVGYHRMISTDFAGFFGKQPKTSQAIEKATRAYLNAIDRWPITFISHLDSVLTTDLYRIGKACKENNILIEINNRHTNWNDRQIEELLASDCMFIVSSDAHCEEDIGVADNAFNLIKKYSIPAENIANVEFEEEELTEEDKENRLYLNLYRQLKKSNNDEEIISDNNENKPAGAYRAIDSYVPVSSGSKGYLSKEMEDALERIALEKGINDYKRKDGQESVVLQDYESRFKGDDFNDELNQLQTENSSQNDFDVDNDISNEKSKGESDENFDLENRNIADNVVNTGEKLDESEEQFESAYTKPKQNFMNHIERNEDYFNKQNENYESQSEENEKTELDKINETFGQFRNSGVVYVDKGTKLDPNREKDSDYELENNQEEQINSIKSQSTNNQYTNNNFDTQNNIFDDDIDYTGFNVNSQSRQQSRSNKKEIVQFNNPPNLSKEKDSLNNNSHTNSSKKTNGFIDFSNFTDDGNE